MQLYVYSLHQLFWLHMPVPMPDSTQPQFYFDEQAVAQQTKTVPLHFTSKATAWTSD